MIKTYTSLYHGMLMVISIGKNYESPSIDEIFSRINQYYNSNREDYEIYIDLSDDKEIANSNIKIIQENR